MLLLHTADWQLGLKAHQAGERAAEVREYRFAAAEAVVDLAREREVDLVVLAGDTFDDLDVDDRVVSRAVAVLDSLAPIPVVVLPGNHDPLISGGVWSRRSWRRVASHVQLLDAASELEPLPGVALYPCPLSQKRSRLDPSEWIPERAAGDDRIRIGVAHGALDRLGVAENFPLAAERVDRCGLDYFALGDWHGLSLHGRAAYPGTIEQTSFSERDPGHVLLVTLEEAAGEAPRPLPRIDAHRVGRLIWKELAVRLQDATDLAALEEEIAGLGSPLELLLRLQVEIAATAPERVRDGFAGLAANLEGQLFLFQCEVRHEGSGGRELPPGLLSQIDQDLERLLAGERPAGSAEAFAEREPEELAAARQLLQSLVRGIEA